MKKVATISDANAAIALLGILGAMKTSGGEENIFRLTCPPPLDLAEIRNTPPSSPRAFGRKKDQKYKKVGGKIFTKGQR